MFQPKLLVVEPRCPIRAGPDTHVVFGREGNKGSLRYRGAGSMPRGRGVQMRSYWFVHEDGNMVVRLEA